MISREFVPGLREHFILVRKWRPIYRPWNLFNSWVRRLTNGKIEPVYITDRLPRGGTKP